MVSGALNLWPLHEKACLPVQVCMVGLEGLHTDTCLSFLAVIFKKF